MADTVGHGTTWTKGPWELRGPTKVYGNLQRDQNSTGDLVATLVSAKDGPLTAAAPRMYDALKALVDRIRDGGRIDPTSPLLRIGCEALLAARGESHG